MVVRGASQRGEHFGNSRDDARGGGGGGTAARASKLSKATLIHVATFLFSHFIIFYTAYYTYIYTALFF